MPRSQREGVGGRGPLRKGGVGAEARLYYLAKRPPKPAPRVYSGLAREPPREATPSIVQTIRTFIKVIESRSRKAGAEVIESGFSSTARNDRKNPARAGRLSP